MKLFLIGTLYDRDELIALKIYKPSTKESVIYSKENIFKKVLEGIDIVGLKLDINGYVKTVKTTSYSIGKLDILNGEGLPIKTTGNYVLLGVNGFLEKARYRLVNSLGEERIVEYNEFVDLVSEGKVNGASKSSRIENKINIYKACNNREYWKEDYNEK